MNIEKLSRQVKITRAEMQALSLGLLLELSESTGIELEYFKRHIVESESIVGTLQGEINTSGPFELCIEGVLLFQMRNEPPPRINAEVFLFSRGERIGPRCHKGNSFMTFQYEFGSGWLSTGWLHDGPDDWERTSKLRKSEYDALTETWEPND